jgi:hypothetical protein
MLLAQRLTQLIAAALMGTLLPSCAGTNALPGTAAYQPTVYRLAADDRV